MNKDHPPVWVFDLDDTLYPPESGLWPQISARISLYIKNHLNISDAEVKRRRHIYHKAYGGALQGLMSESLVNTENFLAYVHDIDYSALDKNTALKKAIAKIEGKKYVFTNGDRPHAERVLHFSGLEGLFDDIYDITAGDLVPKPFPDTYKRFLTRYHLAAKDILFFEDSLANLQTGKALGMKTVLIGPKPNPLPDFIDRHADNLLNYFHINK